MKLFKIAIIAVTLAFSGCGPNVYEAHSENCCHTNVHCISFSSATNVSLISLSSSKPQHLFTNEMYDLVVRQIEYDTEGDQMEIVNKAIIEFFDLPGNRKFGPRERDNWAQGGDAWCALNAGFNIEIDRWNMLVDIWDKDGKHYTELGQELPFIYRREWRESWQNDDITNP